MSIVLSQTQNACPQILAPMAKFTNLPFRLLCRKYGCDIVITEMVSSTALSYPANQKKAQKSLLASTPEEQPVGVQLYGREPEAFRKAIKFCVELGRFSFIDINAGCPATIVRKQGAGAFLLNDLDRLRLILQTCTSVSDLPVSLKIRLGWDRDIADQIVHLAATESLDFVTIHGRLGTDDYSIPANWKRIFAIKEEAEISIVGNGDINSRDQIEFLKATEKCDGIMVGRAARGNPLLFVPKNRQISPETYEVEQYSAFFKYIELLLQKNPCLPYHFVKQQAAHFFKGMVNAAVFRKQVLKTKNLDELTALVELSFR